MSDECKPIDVEVIKREVRELLEAKAALTTERSLTARLRGALKEAGHGCDCPQEEKRSAPWQEHDRDCVRFVCGQALSTPPAAAPVTCEAYCGNITDGRHECRHSATVALGDFCFCSDSCALAGKPLHPPLPNPGTQR